MKIHMLVLAGAMLVSLCASNSQGAIQTIDLTTAGANNGAGTAAALGGIFLVQQVPDQSTGTGVINPFLRVQANGSEQGYNTSNSLSGTGNLDQKAGTWTHALLVSAVPVVNIGGTDYRQFLLDINQNTGGSNELLSLNQVQIFLGDHDPLKTEYTVTAATATTPPQIAFGAGLTEIFRVNDYTNADFTQIKMDYSLNSGSGSGDMFLYVPNSDFAAAGNYVVFYTQFGVNPVGSPSNDGFEEWSVLKGPSPAELPVPEPTTLAIWGLGAIGCAVAGYRRRKLA